ncbi:hypothetical protein [Terasakiella pusilla]|uniref:hypothetical protein n=1 Tax=Terasakiella pusilla TaxID=64973 RepID=UPI003AA7FBBC
MEMNMLNIPESNPMIYFEYFDIVGEIKLERQAAKLVCEMAIDHAIWILGIDVGIFYKNGMYLEDSNEGWLSKTSLMGSETRAMFDSGIARSEDLKNNNDSAATAINEAPKKFNAFILTGKRVRFA